MIVRKNLKTPKIHGGATQHRNRQRFLYYNIIVYTSYTKYNGGP